MSIEHRRCKKTTRSLSVGCYSGHLPETALFRAFLLVYCICSTAALGLKPENSIPFGARPLAAPLRALEEIDIVRGPEQKGNRGGSE